MSGPLVRITGSIVLAGASLAHVHGQSVPGFTPQQGSQEASLPSGVTLTASPDQAIVSIFATGSLHLGVERIEIEMRLVWDHPFLDRNESGTFLSGSNGSRRDTPVDESKLPPLSQEEAERLALEWLASLPGEDLGETFDPDPRDPVEGLPFAERRLVFADCASFQTWYEAAMGSAVEFVDALETPSDMPFSKWRLSIQAHGQTEVQPQNLTAEQTGKLWDSVIADAKKQGEVLAKSLHKEQVSVVAIDLQRVNPGGALWSYAPLAHIEAVSGDRPAEFRLSQTARSMEVSEIIADAGSKADSPSDWCERRLTLRVMAPVTLLLSNSQTNNQQDGKTTP